MKKKLLVSLTVLALTVGGIFLATSAKAKIDPNCINGCVQPADFCVCYGMHNYTEAVHPE